MTDGVPDIASLAALIGDEARAAMLLALFRKGEAKSASSLASCARIGLPAASKHLAKLVGGGLLVCEPRGPERLYSLRDDQVAQLLELLSALAPMRGTRTLSESSRLAALREGRTCYDHLAGQLGVAIFDALVRRDALRPDADLSERQVRKIRSGLGAVAPGGAARDVFSGLGLGLDRELPLATACLDWTENRAHLSGALGALLCTSLMEQGWIIARPNSRAVRLTQAGADALAAKLDLAFTDEALPVSHRPDARRRSPRPGQTRTG
jgi:DNA-binding transcriptional ArsR family regulator